MSPELKTDKGFSESSVDLEKVTSKEIDLTLDEDDGVYIPDGGIRAWINLAGVCAGLTGCMGILNSNGTVEEYLASNVLPNDSKSTIGWIFSILNFLCFGSVLFVAPLFESYGSRVCFSVGIAFFTLGYISMSESTKLYQFILCSVATGTGLSFVFASSIGIIGHYFRKRRAFCLGIGFSGGAVGGIVFPIVMRSLFPKIGFGWTIRVLAFIIISLFLVDLALTSDRRKEINANSELATFYQKTVGKIKLGAFKEKTFTALVIAMACNSFTFLITLTYVVSYSVAAGYSYHASTNLTVIMNATSILGRSCGGWMADRYGRFNVLWIVSTTNTLLFLILWIPPQIAHTYTGLVVFSAIYGVALGSNIPIGPSCVGQISKTTEFSSRYGTSSIVTSMINLTGLPIGGAIIGSGKTLAGYDNMVYFVAGLSIIAWIAASTARYFLVGFAWKKI